MKTNNEQSNLRSLMPLFLVLFIDSMGLGLLFPILASLITDPLLSFLPISTSLMMRDILYGLTVGVFMLSWFFGAAILGDLSDMIGRRTSLMICLVGTAVGYLISAIAVVTSNLELLILGRIIAGVTSGSQPIAQAAIMDVSTPADKSKNMGFMIMFIALGFVFGPILGGVLSSSQVVSWFTLSTPLYFAAIISLLNVGFLYRFFNETFTRTQALSIRWNHAINIFISAFKHEKIRQLSFILLVMILGWSGYFSYIVPFVIEKYDYHALISSLYMGAMGVGFAIGCGYLVNVFTERMGEQKTIIIGFFVSSVFILMTALIHMPILSWLAAVVIGIFMGMGWSNLLVLFSNQVDEFEQGWVMGVTGSIMALAFAFVSFFFGFLVPYGIQFPLITAAIGVFAAAVLLIKLKL